MYTINSSSLIFRIIFVAPPHPGGGSRPSAAAPRGLPGCGEAELSQENGPIKSFELIKHASDIQLWSICLSDSELCGAIANKRTGAARK